LSIKESEKPFWLKPPWTILFDLIKFHRIRPWDVKISYLLTTLIREIRKEGFLDFTASGIALLSSATIYRMKSELILKLQEPPMLPQKIMEDIPPPLQLPYRHEYTSTTIGVLIEALEDVLQSEPLHTKTKPQLIIPPSSITREIDTFLIEIEKNIKTMLLEISELIGEKEMIPFSNLIKNKNRIEIIRSFIIVLFLASRDFIHLTQGDEFGEIHLSLSKPTSYSRTI
jgi:chromatin segregation and condensation protein Rec8/ScpA/Scc1 (kleisin family)